MKIKYLIFLIALTLTGCNATYTDRTGDFILPPELSDYKVIQLQAVNDGPTLYVLVKKSGENRPVIGTTNPQGKVTYQTVIIDGVAYGKLEN